VELFLPFHKFEQRRVLVHAHLHGVSLNRKGATMAATELAGMPRSTAPRWRAPTFEAG